MFEHPGHRRAAIAISLLPLASHANQPKLVVYRVRKDAPFSTIIPNMFFFDQFRSPVGLSLLPYIVLCRPTTSYLDID